jgi:hypothetical protein
LSVLFAKGEHLGLSHWIDSDNNFGLFAFYRGLSGRYDDQRIFYNYEFYGTNGPEK